MWAWLGIVSTWFYLTLFHLKSVKTACLGSRVSIAKSQAVLVFHGFQETPVLLNLVSLQKKWLRLNIEQRIPMQYISLPSPYLFKHT